MVVAASPALVVSEDGVTTATLGFRLTTEPLSAVTVTLAARLGGVSCSPDTLTFDYTNFAEVVNVTLAGIDDDVDQGVGYDDAVDVDVFSEDSWVECDLAERPACGQGAFYGNFTVEPLNVTVVDDDVAGVALAVLSPNASYDNFGDALAFASYTLTLTSEPTAAVNLSVGGLGPYSVAVPDVVTVEPEDWADPVAIIVQAAAPSHARPVCPISDRFCAALGSGRAEVATHRVASEDPYYAALNLSSSSSSSSSSSADVHVSVSVVHDAADPPKVASGRFTDLLNGIVVTLDSSSDRADFTGTFDCSLLLNMTYDTATALFGNAESCVFTSAKSLKIVFGPQATVEPGDVILLRDLTLQAFDPDASLFAMGQSFSVLGPAVPTVPSVRLSASSTSVGVCDDLILDGSATTGSGGRDLTYAFSVAPLGSGGDDDVANVSATLNASNALNGGRGEYAVTVPSGDFQRSSSMVFTLTATNFLGAVGSASVQVEKLGVPAPTLKIRGSNPRETYHSRGLSLTATVSLPTMECVDADLANAKMTFLWTEDSVQYLGSLVGTSKNARALELPENALDPDTTYTFSLLGFMTDAPGVNNTASVEVQVGVEALEAVISGAPSQQYGQDAAFTLDGGDSEDPDESPVPFEYLWTCNATSSSADCSGLLSAHKALNGSALPVPANALTVGTYTFGLAVAKGSRSDGTTVALEVLAGAAPSVFTASLPEDKYNAEEGSYVTLSGTAASSCCTYTTAWSVATGSDVAAPFVLKGSPRATVSNQLSAVVSLGALTPGNTYGLVLTATDSNGKVSASTLYLVMNEAPSSGSVSVSPVAGYALTTAFTFTALGWVDEDLPLTYQFGALSLASDEDPSAGWEVPWPAPFGDPSEDASYSDVALSAGSNGTDYTVGSYSIVRDDYGATATATGALQVSIEPMTVRQLAGASGEACGEAVESGDADAGKQAVKATTGSMGSTTNNETASERRMMRRMRRLGAPSSSLSSSSSSSFSSSSSSSSSSAAAAGDRRRSLLAEGYADAVSLRRTLMATLWDLYDLSPVTEANVAGLIDTLVGILEVPDEVAADTAESGLAFLTTLLRANRAEGLSVDSDVGGDVGAALSYLFETAPFNTTAEASLLFAANATDVLFLATAALLYGSPTGVGFALRDGDVDAYAYRTGAADLLLGGGAVALAAGGSSADDVTSAAFNLSSVGGLGLNATTTLDVVVATLTASASSPSNLFGYALQATRGTAAAHASRFDQVAASSSSSSSSSGSSQEQPLLLLRSPLTVVQVALADGLAPLQAANDEETAWGETSGAFRVTLAATVPFNTSFGAFDRSFGCGTHGAVVDLGCPYEDWTHTCDWASHGGGGPYHVDATCAYVVPTCLYWDESSESFESGGGGGGGGGGEASFSFSSFSSSSFSSSGAAPTCVVEAGYTPDAVTCACGKVGGTVVLSGNTTARAFAAVSTPAPTGLPTSPPSPGPTKSPTPAPTLVPSPSPTGEPSTPPSPAPTWVPSPAPTTTPTTEATTVVSVTMEVTAAGPPTDEDEAALKAAVANATGVDPGDVRNFAISYTTARRNRRRRLVGGVSGLAAAASAAAATPPPRRRRLASYTWDVSLDVVVELSDDDSGSASSPPGAAAFVVAALSGSAFQASLSANLPTAVSGVSGVSGVAATRRPTGAPTRAPPSSSAASAGPPIILIAAATAAALMLCVAGVWYKRKKNKAKNKVGTDAPATGGSPFVGRAEDNEPVLLSQDEPVGEQSLEAIMGSSVSNGRPTPSRNAREIGL